MNRRSILATPILFALAAVTQAQVKAPPLTAAGSASVPAQSLTPANLLPVGKTQGTFHLRGIVRQDRTVVLRWANDQGEMPTEGIRIFRQKVGDSDWKDLTGKKPVGFLQGKAAEKRLRAMPTEDRERILAYPFGDIQHDPITRLRLPDLPKASASRPKAMAPERAKDLSPEKSLQQFRELRAAGRLNRADLQLMHVRADMDTGLAEVLGLTYTDDPGKGQWRYKLVIALPEGGSVEVVTPKVLNTLEPTPIPQPINLSAASGNGEVLLNWDETPSDVVAGYNVYRAENPGGPWRRLNSDPVKRVQLELEDPEITLRRSRSVQGSMERMLRPLPAAARTPQKVMEAQRLAVEQAQKPGGLVELSPAASRTIKDAVASGRLRPGGLQAPRSLYTDSRHTEGNVLQDEKTYQYRVTAVDLGGLEQPMDTAPVVAGIPKDLEPPQVPGQPMLKSEMAARTDLHAAQAARLKDTRLVALNQTVVAKLPKAAPSYSAFSTPAAPAAAAAPMAGNLSLGEAKRMQLSRTAATMPVSALQKLGEAAVLHSNPDGSVPPAALAWSPSPDADLKGYEVHRATGSGAFTKVADTTAAEWTDTGLDVGQAYRYAICSVDKLGNVSARSPEGRLEVSDSSLPGRLAIAQLTGQLTKDAPVSIPARRFLRPADRMMASGSLRSTKAPIQQVKTTEPTLSTFHAPASAPAPKVKARFIGVSATRAPLAKNLATVSASDTSTLKVSALVKPTFRRIERSFNPMLAALTAPKELHVLLEWVKPVQGFPMEYVITQAPQRMEAVSILRPTVAFATGLHGFEALRATVAPTALRPAGAINMAPAAPAPTVLSTAALPTAHATSASSHALLVTTSALHAQAARGLVTSTATGLHIAENRRDQMTKLVPATGPGTFTRASEAPVTTERFIVTFPAEVAQYGGATFYFRVQSFTKEFGRTVEGPVSAPIEVRLPDIVPPPSPTVGAVDLQEGAAGSLDVALTWTQSPAKDFAGTLVDRQPMAYTLVEGEAKATGSAGPAERITATPITGLAYTDKKAPAGYQRYTLRSVDATGNISEPLGSMDVLVPGEPVPGAPTQLALSGNRLVWKAAPDAVGYTVWRSFSGLDEDYACISGILGSTETSFVLPAEGTLHLRVVARSASGMNTTPSQPLVRTP
jgi:fibronectin type 3 domain-containing protein